MRESGAHILVKEALKRQYSTISDTIEVGCHYSGDTQKLNMVLLGWNKRDFTEVMLYAEPTGIHRNFPSGEGWQGH